MHTDDRAAATTPGDGGAPGSSRDAGAALTLADLPPALAAALAAAVDKGGRAPAILRVTQIAGYTDYVLIVSARNERQVSSIADAVSIAARTNGATLLGVEGTGEHLWDLLDFDDFMVHVFFHPVRTHYDLESMWSDAPRVALGLPADVMDTAELEALALPDGLPTYHGDATFGGFDDEFGDAPPRRPSRPTRAARPRPASAPDDSLAGGQIAAGSIAEGHDDDFDDDFDDDDGLDDDFDDEPADDAFADDEPADDDFDDEPADDGPADDAPATGAAPAAKPGRDRS